MKKVNQTNKVISEEHPDWKAFKNQGHNDVVFTNFAYGKTDEAIAKIAKEIPSGYEMFLMTDHVNDSKEASFRCVAFLNQETKEIVFATAGTRPGFNQKGFDDLYDDVLLIAQNKPAKMNPAQILNDMILDSLGQQAKDYKFHYTGHSLGAAMAEMQAVDMDIKLQQKGLKNPKEKDQISAVTFENPGTKPIVEKMYKEAGLAEDSVKKLNFCEFNNRKNIINTLNPQSGNEYIIVPHSQKERNPNFVQMMFEVVSKYVSGLSPIIGKVFGLLAPGGIGMELPSDHSLSNFNEVFVQKAGIVKDKRGSVISMQEAYSGITPIEYDEKLVNKIKDLKQSSKIIDKPEFSMDRIDKNTHSVDRVVFSLEELQKANNLMQTEGMMMDEKSTFASKLPPRAEKNIIAQIINSKTTEPASNLKLATAKETLEGLNRSR